MRATPLILAAIVGLAGCGTSLAARSTLRAEPGGVQQGYASYYSDRLAGRSTANGEPYDPTRLTAAHRTLPFGTRVEVQRVDTGARVEVRINDRGPFAGTQRIIDLSRSAAEAIAMIRAGVVAVTVRVLSVPTPR
ncbi:MAG: septal ring lytic transglycosylase RlpA family protein [Deltaproteobacteria bacterium]|nr:septal ring lytic transglycosylase RlpA family protein [Myxococcales bacterium]MDP3221216.1 septal ring lytic transglycosylase RlpA family protein [Deltaproteobacteria bacterium]